jgi:hypothetical protein
MVGRVAFFVIISIAILFVILFAFIAIFEGWTDVRVNELKEEVATLQSEATQAAEVANNTQADLKAAIALQEASFTATVQSFYKDIDKVSQTAAATADEGTAMAEEFTRLSATATSVVVAATEQAPMTVKVSYQETVSLFGDALSIRLDDYSTLLSSEVTITVQSPNSVSQTFDIDLGEVVLYKGHKNYTILRSDNGKEKDEQGDLIVEFVVAGN